MTSPAVPDHSPVDAALRFRIGQAVTFCGLSTAAVLNGSNGTIQDSLSASGRFPVLAKATGKVISCKSDNLLLADWRDICSHAVVGSSCTSCSRAPGPFRCFYVFLDLFDEPSLRSTLRVVLSDAVLRRQRDEFFSLCILNLRLRLWRRFPIFRGCRCSRRKTRPSLLPRRIAFLRRPWRLPPSMEDPAPRALQALLEDVNHMLR